MKSCYSLDSSGQLEGSDSRSGKAQGVHVGYMLDCMVEGLHVIALQGEKRLRGVNVNLQGEKETGFEVGRLASSEVSGQEAHRRT